MAMSPRSLVTQASVRLSNAERSVASLRAAIAREAGGARVEQLKRLLAEREAEAEQARRTWEELKNLPSWQLEERFAQQRG